ncbi:sulfite exporter TauE/SafE family protein [Spongiimicrobium salis]|uniref:sulfite exporter TauE/SafE family protein n=1 Tax=Spongiimicrobium salis TaxID=1667022 RepID=UPI00374D1253
MLLFAVPDISVTSWFFAFAAAFIMGISKSGIKGIGIVIVTLMALAFGAKESTGIMMPLLIAGDIYAVSYYNRHTQWKYIVRFLPWMMLGVLIGVFVGKDLPEYWFKLVMATIILGSVLLMFWWDRKKSKTVPTHWFFASFMGIMAGITTMIGNLAGPVSSIFFLAMRLPKNEFIGTAAWLFLFINLFKLPFHAYVWETITLESLLIDLKLILAVVFGLLVGTQMVKKIQEGFYRKMILVLTALGALMLFFK